MFNDRKCIFFMLFWFRNKFAFEVECLFAEMEKEEDAPTEAENAEVIGGIFCVFLALALATVIAADIVSYWDSRK